MVTKNAILLVDYANQAREEVLPAQGRPDASCLRPISHFNPVHHFAMTPCFGIGEGELRQSISVVLVGGLFTLTLLVIPSTFFEEWKENAMQEKLLNE